MGCPAGWPPAAQEPAGALAGIAWRGQRPGQQLEPVKTSRVNCVGHAAPLLSLMGLRLGWPDGWMAGSLAGRLAAWLLAGWLAGWSINPVNHVLFFVCADN